jgi:hypothetical protein
VRAWIDDPAKALAAGENGRLAVAANRGAVDRLLAMIEPLLGPPAASTASSSAGRSATSSAR